MGLFGNDKKAKRVEPVAKPRGSGLTDEDRRKMKELQIQDEAEYERNYKRPGLRRGI